MASTALFRRRLEQHFPEKLKVDIRTNDVFGRHYIAVEEILAGTLIIREKAIVSVSKSQNMCTACSKLMARETQCQRCGWPLCEPCSNDEVSLLISHPECKVLSVGKDQQPWKRWRCHWKIFALLRCFHLENLDIEAWELVNELQDNIETLSSTSWLPSCFENIVFPLKKECHSDLPARNIIRMSGILDTNSLEVIAGRQQKKSVLCPLLSLISHDCRPNCNRFYDVDGEVCLVAARDIPAGDVITLSYTNTWWTGDVRRDHLRLTKRFICGCSRCVYPGESDVFLSALKCRSEFYTNLPELDCPGYLSKIGDVFVCSECRQLASVNRIEMFVGMTNKSFRQSMSKAQASGDSRIISRWIEKQSQILHKQHSLMLQAAFNSVELDMDLCKLEDYSNERKHSLLVQTRHLLSVTSSLEPGLTKTRGKLLCYHAELLHASMDDDQYIEYSREAAEILRYDGQYGPRCLRLLEDYQIGRQSDMSGDDAEDPSTRTKDLPSNNPNSS